MIARCVTSSMLLVGGFVLAACGDRVSLGGGGSGAGAGPIGGSGPQPGTGAGAVGIAGGSVGEPCFDVPCGAPCEGPVLDECNDESCPVEPWFCNELGACEAGLPLCGETCGALPCGAPCEVCEPDNGSCSFGVCDGYGFCTPDTVCFEEPPCEVMQLSCGDICDPCEGWFPPESCPYDDNPSSLFVCDGAGDCMPSDEPICPPYDSCIELGSSMCEPCTNCAPNDPSCSPEVPKFCDALGMCSEIADPGCP